MALRFAAAVLPYDASQTAIAVSYAAARSRNPAADASSMAWRDDSLAFSRRPERARVKACRLEGGLRGPACPWRVRSGAAFLARRPSEMRCGKHQSARPVGPLVSSLAEAPLRRPPPGRD